MPTGYTADIQDGISFRTFAMNCARAFGACVMLRDAPGGGDQIPEAFEPSDYNAKALDKAKADLAALSDMPSKALQRAADKAFDDEETARLQHIQEKRDARRKYEEMLSQVDAWKPPTPDHIGLQAFMREQIVQSIDFDCDEKYYSTPVVRLTGAQWANARRVQLLRDIAHHAKGHAEEVERTNTRNEWVRQLRQAL
jgi:hypothetical protein